jgi:hypothetical protein
VGFTQDPNNKLLKNKNEKTTNNSDLKICFMVVHICNVTTQEAKGVGSFESRSMRPA